MLQKYNNLPLPGKLVCWHILIWILTQAARFIHLPWEYYLALFSDSAQLALHPWSLFSYMWVHANLGDDLFHIIFNMMWLWYFGLYFIHYHTNRQLLGLYITGGLAGGIAFFLFGNGYLVGASGAIFALVAAVAVRQPNELIYLNLFVKVVPIRMKWFALIALGINILHLMGGDNVGGIICHLGGMLTGVNYELCLRYGRFRQLGKSKTPNLKATVGGKRTVQPDKQKDMDYNTRQKEYQQRIDAILDKISKSGYDGLSADEKAALFDASQRKKR